MSTHVGFCVGNYVLGVAHLVWSASSLTILSNYPDLLLRSSKYYVSSHFFIQRSCEDCPIKTRQCNYLRNNISRSILKKGVLNFVELKPYTVEWRRMFVVCLATHPTCVRVFSVHHQCLCLLFSVINVCACFCSSTSTCMRVLRNLLNQFDFIECYTRQKTLVSVCH